MIVYEDECIGCPPGQGCLGNTCPNRNVPHLYCDKCKDEMDTLYHWDGEQWCMFCIEKSLDKVKAKEGEYG